MRPDQERVRNLLIDTVTLLCKNSVQFDNELHVEGLLGVSVDKKDVFFVHISKEFSNSPSDGATVTESHRDSQEDIIENSSESNDTQQQRHSIHNTPTGDDRVSVKTEAIENPDGGDECLIVEEPHIKLEGRVSPAQLIAGQRRPAKRTSHSGSNSQYGGDSSLQGAYGESSYGGPQFPGMGEPPAKRHASDSGGGQHDDYQEDNDDGEGTPWPTLAGPQGFDPSQSFQHDSDNSQLSLDGTQAGCSSWSTPGRGPSDSMGLSNEEVSVGVENIGKKKPCRLECTVCGRLLTDRWSLDRHMKSHTGEKPFQCPFCPHKSKRKDHLKKHLETHGPTLQGIDGGVFETGDLTDGGTTLTLTC